MIGTYSGHLPSDLLLMEATSLSALEAASRLFVRVAALRLGGMGFRKVLLGVAGLECWWGRYLPPSSEKNRTHTSKTFTFLLRFERAICLCTLYPTM